MAGGSQLNERSKAVLEEIIHSYIACGEPVGSRSVSKCHFEKLSPATIRNIMFDLDEMGYLRQPHTSAGRVPTDKGYRFFVDQILGRQLPGEFPGLAEIYENCENKPLEEVLEEACERLSKSANQAGIVMLPSFSQMLLKHVEFIKVGATEVLAVFISDLGVLQNKIVHVGKDVTQENLASIAKYLNEEFQGKSLKIIRRELLRRIRHEREHYDQLMKKAVDLWTKAFSSEEEEGGELLIEGASHFLDHCELSSDLEKMKVLIKTVEEKTKLIKLLDLCLKQDGVAVIIGDENLDEDMRECSLIARHYRSGEEKIGAVAVFGPKRMDYQKMISIVNLTAQTVSNILSARNRKGV